MKSLTETPKLRSSKTESRFWKSRLFKRSTDDWQVQIAFGGRRQRFPLGTPNKEAAASKARDIYVSLLRVGWDETLATFKPWAVKTPKPSDFPTVGEFLQQVRALSDLRPVTFEIYARKFRRLVAGVAEIEGDKDRFDYVNRGYHKWREKVESIRLSDLTPTKIQAWKVEQLKKSSATPLAYKHAQSTVASIIRAGKSLFAKGILEHLATLRLPNPLPFDGIKAGSTGSHRYKSEINPSALLKQMIDELREPEPELFKICILALLAGLRRDEIDTLEWSQIDWDRHAIRIGTTAHTAAKSLASEDEIDVDAQLLAILRKYHPTCTDKFVINSPIAPRPATVSYHHYRCNRLFKKANNWLRGKGVPGRSPLHTLRKEFGSLICAQAGIFAASVALRHGNISLTRDYYVDKKQRVSLSIEGLLNPKKSPDAGPSKESPPTPASDAGSSTEGHNNTPPD